MAAEIVTSSIVTTDIVTRSRALVPPVPSCPSARQYLLPSQEDHDGTLVSEELGHSCDMEAAKVVVAALFIMFVSGRYCRYCR